MSFIQQTEVWIKRSILLDAARLVGEAIKNTETDDNWGWCRAVLVKGNIKLQDDLTLRIEDEDLVSTPKELFISKELIIKQTKSSPVDSSKVIVIANSFTESNDFLPPDNLMSLTHLHEPALVYSLKRRFEAGHIHTATGDILLIVNPFEQFEELYNSITLNKYMKQGSFQNNDNVENVLPPHIFSFADKAYRHMRKQLSMSKTSSKITYDQCVLVSGESGAGKTVTTKHIMKYLSSLSQNETCSTSSSLALQKAKPISRLMARSKSIRSSRRMSRMTTQQKSAAVEQKILESNPILESFGNARTVRNDNSSRFGKFIELQFKNSGALVGASIETYLLEKVRLVHQAEGERNYHIFYELLSAVDSDDREKYLLEDFTAEDFHLTNQSGIYDRRDMVDDLEQFDLLVMSMNGMGFNSDQQQQIFSVVSSLLHASNVNFSVSTSDESKLDFDNPHLKHVTDLLGLDVNSFNDALCAIYIEVGKERHRKAQPKDKAEKGLEAVVKAIYSALFNHIVAEINTNIACKKRGKDGIASFIGVLDIFGFESFKINSLEQLFINYCNEALQQQFNAFVFRLEQDVYQREGIDWSLIEFPDNQDVLDLIEKKRTGLISVLDDQCKAPGTTDQTFASLLYRTCKNHTRFEANFRQIGKKRFGIKHYAGSVEYDTINFLEKNRDETPRETIELLKSSSKPFLEILVKQHQKTVTVSSSFTRSFKANQITAGGQFKSQLQSLRQKIDKTTPHYVRCLKPNSDLIAGEFNSNMISAQLQSAGVLEVIRISRVGYSQRFPHHEFLKRYELLDMEKMIVAKRKKVVSKQRCETLIKSVSVSIFDKLKLSSHGIQMGKTKVFLWQKHFDQLEYYRDNKMTNSVTILQSQARGFIARSHYVKLVPAAIVIQKSVRRFLAIKLFTSIQREHSVIFIALWCQSVHRGRTVRKKYQLESVSKTAKLYSDETLVQQIGYRSHIEHVNSALKLEEKEKDFETMAVLELLNDFEGKRNALEQMSNENVKLLQQIEEMRNSTIEETNNLREKLERTTIEKEKSIHELKFVSASKNEEFRSLNEEIERLKLELSERKEKQKELSISIIEKDKELENKTYEKDKELEKMKVDNESLKKEIELMRDSFTEALGHTQNQIQSSYLENAKIFVDFEEKDKKLKKISVEKESLMQQMDELRQSSVEESHTLMEKLEQQQVVLEEQSKQRQQLSNEIEGKSIELGKITIEKENLIQQMELLSTSKNEETLALTEKLESLQLELDEQKEKRQELSNVIMEKDKELEKMTHENDSLMQNNDYYVEESNTLRKKLDKMQLELDEQSEQRKSLLKKYENSLLLVTELKEDMVTLKNSFVERDLNNIDSWKLNASANLEQMKADLNFLKDNKSNSQNQGSLLKRIFCSSASFNRPSIEP